LQNVAGLKVGANNPIRSNLSRLVNHASKRLFSSPLAFFGIHADFAARQGLQARNNLSANAP
jgi:hypothetical protein